MYDAIWCDYYTTILCDVIDWISKEKRVLSSSGRNIFLKKIHSLWAAKCPLDNGDNKNDGKNVLSHSEWYP